VAETHIEELGAAGTAHGMPHGSHPLHPSAKEYVRIFLILLTLTALEVGAVYAHIGSWLIPTLFFLAITKFALVVLWFMHLKFDDRRFSRFFLMGLAGALTLYLVVLMAFKVFLR
jgi:cytochrome c oxidase subunit 4